MGQTRMNKGTFDLPTKRRLKRAQHYSGIFFEERSKNLLLALSPDHLEEVINFPHITFGYNKIPKDMVPYDGMYLLDPKLIGQKTSVWVVGVGNDGANAGVLVKLKQEDQELYSGAEVVHITTSLALDAKAANTKNIKFCPIEPVEIEGVYGIVGLDNKLYA